MARVLILTRTDGSVTRLSPNAYAQIAAKRKYGLEALNVDPEPGLFSAFVQDVGPAAAAVDGAFDEWLQTVIDLQVEGDTTEDPPTATVPTSPEPSPE